MPDDTPAPLGDGTWRDTFRDVRGSYSSKRIIAFIALSVYLLGFFLAVFTKYAPPEGLMQGFFLMVMAGVGMAGLEHFTAGR